MSLQPKFYDRALSGTPLLANSGVEYKVNSLRWGVWGGPITATITALGGEKALGDLFSRLRCPIEVVDEQGRVCWWGYVSGVRIRIGQLEVAVSLDQMANRVAVAYSYIEPGTQTVGIRKTTAWVEDTSSQGIYGIKEFISSASGLADAVATARANVLLALRKLPQSSASYQGGSGNTVSAILECRGWWETLNWRYYPSGAPVGTSYKETAGSTIQTMGNVTGAGALIQDFTTPAVPGYSEPLSVAVYLRRTATVPASSFIVTIEEAGTPFGRFAVNSLFYGEMTPAAVPTTIQWVTFTPLVAKTMKANTVYRLMLFGNVPPDTYYYTLGVNEALGYGGGALKLVGTGGVEAARSPDADLLFDIGVANTPDTTLIAAGAIGYGQFITAVDIETPAGVDMTAYSDGDSLVKDLVEDLMLSGGPNGRRLLATVDVNRKARIYEEPAAIATYLMDRTGRLMTSKGGAVVPYMPPVGVYVRIQDMLPASADLGLIADPTLQFIEGAEWSSSGGLRVEFRGERSIDELTRISQDAPRASTGFRPVIVRPSDPRNGGLQ